MQTAYLKHFHFYSRHTHTQFEKPHNAVRLLRKPGRLHLSSHRESKSSEASAFNYFKLLSVISLHFSL